MRVVITSPGAATVEEDIEMRRAAGLRIRFASSGRLVLLLAVMFGVVACGGSDAERVREAGEDTAVEGGSVSAEEPPAPTTTLPPAEPTTTAAATSTTAETPADGSALPLSASEVYELVAPSIVFVETETGTGSGILIDGGYVVNQPPCGVAPRHGVGGVPRR